MPPPNDHVLLTTGNAQIAVFVDPAEIASHEPTVTIEGLLRSLLVVEIAEHQARATTTNLTDLVRLQCAVGIFPVKDSDLIAGAGFSAAFDD